jgi:hypothetical protein
MRLLQQAAPPPVRLRAEGSRPIAPDDAHEVAPAPTIAADPAAVRGGTFGPCLVTAHSHGATIPNREKRTSEWMSGRPVEKVRVAPDIAYPNR